MERKFCLRVFFGQGVVLGRSLFLAFGSERKEASKQSKGEGRKEGERGGGAIERKQ